MKKRGKNDNGITLIALVITIIVLLILAGISIATLTGQNGVLNKAVTAKDENKKAEYKEIVQLIGNGIRPEKVLENLNTEEFMNRYQTAIEEEIEKGETLKEATLRRKDEESIVVVTKEKYVYLVTENKVEYLGKQTGENLPNLLEEDVEYVIKPETEWTNTDVSVEIKSKIEGYILEYSTNGVTWKTYVAPVIMKENGTIHARLSNGLEQAGSSSSKKITKIDKKAPTGNIETTSVKPSSITISITAQDVVEDEKNGCSGIKGYYYSNDGGKTYSEIKTEASYKFEELTSGTDYNIAVKVVDNAGNPTELTLNVKTTEPIYIVKDGKFMMGSPTFTAEGDTTNQGSYCNAGENYAYCRFYYYAVARCWCYWSYEVLSDDMEVHFVVDAPYESLGYRVEEQDAYLFASGVQPNASNGFGSITTVKSYNSCFTGGKEFVVKPGHSGKIYFGLLGGTQGGSSGMPHYCNLRIYNAWIE